MRAVVKLGGALFRREPNVTSLKGMGRALGGFVEDGNQLVLVAGGGGMIETHMPKGGKLGADGPTSVLLEIKIPNANRDLGVLPIACRPPCNIPPPLS